MPSAPDDLNKAGSSNATATTTDATKAEAIVAKAAATTSADAPSTRSKVKRGSTQWTSLQRAMDMLLKPLPADWHRAYTSAGRIYYWNAVSNGVQYEAPVPLPYGWRLARDRESGCVYVWNYFTRESAPYEPFRKALGLATPRPLGSPPAPPTLESVSIREETLMCGWSELKRADDSHSPQYFCLSKDATLQWFDKGEQGGNLKLAGSLDIHNLCAIKREEPDSIDDFSFSIVLESKQKVVVDPGNRASFERWEESLLTALSFPLARVRRSRTRSAASSEPVPPQPRRVQSELAHGHAMPHGPISADL